MWPGATRCDQEWLDVTNMTRCDQVRPDVTKSYFVWPGVTNVTICDQEWLDVTRCDKCDEVCPDVTGSDYKWLGVTNVTRCEEEWLDVTSQPRDSQSFGIWISRQKFFRSNSWKNLASSSLSSIIARGGFSKEQDAKLYWEGTGSISPCERMVRSPTFIREGRGSIYHQSPWMKGWVPYH